MKKRFLRAIRFTDDIHTSNHVRADTEQSSKIRDQIIREERRGGDRWKTKS